MIFQGRAVQTAQSLDEGLASVTEIKSTHVVEPQLFGQLIHLSDKLSCDEVCSFHITVKSAGSHEGAGAID